MEEREKMVSLPRGQWMPENWERLNRMIERNAFRGRYACFDFDDTTSVHGVDCAQFFYQVRMLRYAMEPDRFAQILSTGLPGLEQELGRNRAGEPVRIGQLLCDLVSDYAWLYRHYIGLNGGGTLDLPEIHQTPEYRDFEAKMHWIHLKVVEVLPMEISYPWLVYLSSGFRPEEAYELGEKSIYYGTAPGRYGHVILTSPEERRGAAGVLSIEIDTGVSFPPEMRALYRTLEANGITVYLISASPMDLVRAGSSCLELGVPEDQIYAMRLRRDTAGRYINEYDYDWGGQGKYAQTFRNGKIQIIRNFLMPKHGGRGPVLVGGDSENDMPMMTEWMDCGDTELGLIFNHLELEAEIPNFGRQPGRRRRQKTAVFCFRGWTNGWDSFVLPKRRFCRTKAKIGSFGRNKAIKRK